MNGKEILNALKDGKICVGDAKKGLLKEKKLRLEKSTIHHSSKISKRQPSSLRSSNRFWSRQNQETESIESEYNPQTTNGEDSILRVKKWRKIDSILEKYNN